MREVGLEEEPKVEEEEEEAAAAAGQHLFVPRVPDLAAF